VLAAISYVIGWLTMGRPSLFTSNAACVSPASGALGAGG